MLYEVITPPSSVGTGVTQRMWRSSSNSLSNSPIPDFTVLAGIETADNFSRIQGSGGDSASTGAAPPVLRSRTRDRRQERSLRPLDVNLIRDLFVDGDGGLPDFHDVGGFFLEEPYTAAGDVV